MLGRVRIGLGGVHRPVGVLGRGVDGVEPQGPILGGVDDVEFVLPLAFSAKSVHHDIPVLNPSPSLEFIGKSRLIEGCPLKIDDLFTAPADEMMVRCAVRLVAGVACGRLDFVDESVPGQGAERTVDRIQRNRGKLHQKAPVKLFHGRMIRALRQYAENLQPLGREPEAGPPADIPEFVKFIVSVFHQGEVRTVKNDY